MPTYLNPELTVARAGFVLEREFRKRYSEQEYERLYRTIDLLAQEHSTDQEQQVLGIICLIRWQDDRAGQSLSHYPLAC